jgi:hypothetical protein
MSYKIARCWCRLPIVLVILLPAMRIALVLSIFIGIGALALVIRELRSAPLGYESEDGFRFGVQACYTQSFRRM